MRASYAESEENKISEEGADGSGSQSDVKSGTESSTSKSADQNKSEQLTGDHSGHKSMEGVTDRKDYSIDMKTEEIYRQFTSNSDPEPQSKQTVKLATGSGHPSIEETNEEQDEEDEEDMVEIFF